MKTASFKINYSSEFHENYIVFEMLLIYQRLIISLEGKVMKNPINSYLI